MELYCLKLCLIQHVVQILLSFSVAQLNEFSSGRPTASGRSGSDQLLLKLLDGAVARNSLATDITRHNLDTGKLVARLETSLLPFLRCSALLFSHLTDVSPGSDLVDDGGSTYSSLAAYLGLPPWRE